jgi:uncharacterized protein YecE (DUF72 family)
VPQPVSSLPCPAHIGCAGWSIPREAAGHFASGASHLHRYAQIFNACEINSSFYRPHKIETWQRWGESVPATFRFSVKAPRTITHEARLKCGGELLSPFLHQISFLKDKLGPILFQLPPSLEYAAVPTKLFLSILRDLYPVDVVWEPRHASWFTGEVEDVLKQFQIGRVAADPACVPAAGEPGGHSSLVYFRLHGSPRKYYSSYSEEFLDTLAAQLADLGSNATTKTKTWCVFDNTAAGFALPNALALRERLADSSGWAQEKEPLDRRLDR